MAEDKASLMEVHLMKQAFEKVDTSGDGFIGLGELTQFMQELEQWSESDLKGIFESLDKDKSGSIRFHEFIDYVMHEEEDATDQRAADAIQLEAEEKADDGQGEALENQAQLEAVDFDADRRVNLKEFLMICRRLDEDDDEAREIFERHVEELEQRGEGTASGIPLHEFFHALQIEPEDREAMKHFKKIVDDVSAKLLAGQDDPPPTDAKVYNSAINNIVRELDQARRPPEEAWAIFTEGKVPLSKAGQAAVRSYEHKQAELVSKVKEFGLSPPLLTSSAGQAGNREHCISTVSAIIAKCKADGTKFTDPEWDVNKDPKSVLYVDKQKPGYDCTVGKPDGYMRLPDIIKANPVLFKGGARAGDIKQGQIGTCFLLGALGAVVSNNEKIPHKVFIKYDIDVGVYGVRFNVNGEWSYVVIDDLMPVDSYGHLLFAHSKDKSEMWCPLIEKAFCKLHTCYEMCDGGRAGEAIFSFLGGTSGRLMIKKAHLSDPSKYFKTLKQARERGWILTTAFAPRPGVTAAGQGKCGEAMLPGGLVGGHVYSVLKCVEAEGNQLVCCRNPWGTGEWTGRWSDKNAEGEWTDSMKKAAGYERKNDGKFWMSIADFTQSSSGASYARVYGPNWKKLTQVKHFAKGSMKAKSQWAYKAGADDELGFNAHDTIEVHNIAHGWWYGKVAGGDKLGFFPGNYVKLDDRPVARFDLHGTPNSDAEGPMVAVVALMQPNSGMARKFAKRKEDGLDYKDLSYPLMQLYIVGPDGSLAMKKEGRQRELSGEVKLPGGGQWKIYAMSADGLGGDFLLRTYVKDGAATLTEVPGTTIEEISALLS